MKIQDYQSLRIESKVLNYCLKKNLPAVITPGLEIYGKGPPATYVPGKRTELPLDKIYISNCIFDQLKPNANKYRLIIVAHKKLFRALGHHTQILKMLQPVAAQMGCSIEGNYHKCSYKHCEKVIFTMVYL